MDWYGYDGLEDVEFTTASPFRFFAGCCFVVLALFLFCAFVNAIENEGDNRKKEETDIEQVEDDDKLD